MLLARLAPDGPTVVTHNDLAEHRAETGVGRRSVDGRRDPRVKRSGE